ncbi:MAG: response regulator [Alphaproteobacteria bacterium]|nr:response regulator [Alphaproteobacteria bacterium]
MSIVKSKTVLIAEDNELNMKLFKDLLEMKNFKTICIEDGHQVFDAIVKEQPDLILMDIRLNDISGLDIIKQIKDFESTKHIPVIALTAFAMKSDREKIMQSGCEGYMAKPIFIDTFFKEVEKFLS